MQATTRISEGYIGSNQEEKKISSQRQPLSLFSVSNSQKTEEIAASPKQYFVLKNVILGKLGEQRKIVIRIQEPTGKKSFSFYPSS